MAALAKHDIGRAGGRAGVWAARVGGEDGREGGEEGSGGAGGDAGGMGGEDGGGRQRHLANQEHCPVLPLTAGLLK